MELRCSAYHYVFGQLFALTLVAFPVCLLAVSVAVDSPFALRAGEETGIVVCLFFVA